MSDRFEANRFPLEPGFHLLEASAGTGKTFALAHLVLRLVAEAELNLRQLLVVTFTEAAAAELRDRIGRRLQAALAGLAQATPTAPAADAALASWLEHHRPRAAALQARLLLALEELDAADITTIHGFCRRTLQRQALEAGQPPNLQLNSDAALLVQQISHDYWQQQVLSLPAALVAGLQRAGAGPGPLADLLLRLDGDPALQLDALPADLDAEQGVAEQLLARWRHNWHTLVQLWPQHSPALEAQLLATAKRWREEGHRKTDPYKPTARRDRRGEVAAWLASQPPDGDYGAVMARQGAAELLHTYFHPGTLAKVTRAVEGREPAGLPQLALLEAVARVVDGAHDDLLLHAAHWGRAELRRRRERSGQLGFSQLLEGLDPGEQASTPLLQAVGQRYAVALVDEFQDTDPIQWRILSRAFQPGRHLLVMVGDPKQAIYRFRGGELATYLAAKAAASASGGVRALTDNYRAAEPLIQGLNGLMRPGLVRSGLAVPELRAQAPVAALERSGPGLALELLWLGGTRQAGQKPPSRSGLEQQLAGQIASTTAELLNGNHPGGLSPGQICLLVSTHSQAEALRQALERCAIASRLVSKGDVFESAGATALQRLLDALARPGESRRLRLLAASPLLAWSAAAIATAGPEAWSGLAGRLADLAAQLPRRGLLGVLGALLRDRGVARLALGGRLLADLQQCAELVQERLHTDQLGAAAAADWLRRLRLEPDRQVPESHQPHSDGVDEAVAVVTVHRSKGLEYPVVICPFLWQAPSGTSPGGRPRPGVRWQPEGCREPQLDLHRNGQWGPGYSARRQQLQAELAERERLAYVAATRAQRLLLLAWGPATGQQGNPLHPWLFSQDGAPDPDHDPYQGRSDAEWLDRLQGEIARRQLPVAVRQPPAPGVLVAYQPAAAAATAALACGPRPRRRFDSSWGRSSYSSWTHGSHASSPAALEEGRETDARTCDPEQQPGDQESREADGPLASFPRGSQAGDCLHRILEQLDLQQPLAGQAELCSAELRRAGIDGQHLPPLLAGLERLRQLPLGGPLGCLRLGDLAHDSLLREMNFDLPLAPVRAADLAAAFAHHPDDRFGADYARQLAMLPVASQGFLTGSIDLIFEHDERWWVVDWKSNWLGERDGDGSPLHCGPRHYGAASLTALMAANHYPLQAHLYLVALHRYLAWRLPGYRPEQHLGGYLYVFLRGLPEAGAPQPAPGLFFDQPPLQRLLALDQTLAGAGQGP
ncbi:MAG: UvrD-helicase domain-containing protein [Cyanobacteria bacterium]|nr:UvrD-helicase domain-containing protein [Cyanobacteriota bacterium]